MPKNIRRQQLIVAASEIFAQRGYYLSGMDEIAETAGVTKPVLYQHFPGKLELYLAVLSDHTNTLVSGVRQALRSTTNNHERLRAAVRAYFDYVDRDSQGYRLLFNSDVTEPVIQSRINKAFEDCTDAISDLVSSDSGLDPFRSRIIAVALVGASQTSAQYWMETCKSVSKDEAVDTAVSLMWGGLAHVPIVKNLDTQP